MRYVLPYFFRNEYNVVSDDKEVKLIMSDLSEFLKRKKEQFNQEQVDWEIVKEEWIEQAKDFMETIKNWLADNQNEGLIDISEKEIEITEEHIGKYAAPSLELIIGAESIQVTTIGRFVIGASGRIDIHSYIGRFIVLYHSENGWIYRKEGQQGSFQPFTEENFTKILKELV